MRHAKGYTAYAKADGLKPHAIEASEVDGKVVCRLCSYPLAGVGVAPEKCEDCGRMTLTPASPLYDGKVCIYCVRRDSVPGYSMRLAKRTRTY